MKKLFVLLSLISFIGLHQSRACSCDILPTFRVSLYYNYDFVNHMPDSPVYVFLALNAENFENNSAGNLDSAHKWCCNNITASSIWRTPSPTTPIAQAVPEVYPIRAIW